MISELHAAWQKASGQELNPRATERIFYEVEKLGFTAEDVTLAVKHMQKFNAKSGGAKFRINAYKILSDTESFASLVAEARASERNRRPAPTEKEKVAQSLRPVVDPEQSSTLSQSAGHHVSAFIRRP